MPFTVSTKGAPPAAVVEGDSDVTVGTGFPTALIVNDPAFDVPPPGVGLSTVTCADPAVAMSLARIDAVSCVALTNVVERLFPFHRTVEDDTKFKPFTVRTNAAPPAVALAGDTEETDGIGLVGPVDSPPDEQPENSDVASESAAINAR